MADDDNPFRKEPPSSDAFGRPIGDSGEAPGAPGPADWAPPPSGDPWSAPPAPPPSGEYAAPPANRKADGAIPALVLGILGIVLCPLCAPFAWVLGQKAERLVDASGGMLSGRGEATAGKILGIIGTVLIVLGILLIIVLIAVGASVDSGDTSTTFDF
jgi:hypothetical protein